MCVPVPLSDTTLHKNIVHLLQGRLTQRQRVVRISALTQTILFENCYGIPQSLWTNSGKLPPPGNDGFLPNPFRFVIRALPHHSMLHSDKGRLGYGLICELALHQAELSPVNAFPEATAY